MPREAGEEAGSRAGVTAGYWEPQQRSWIWAQTGISPCSGRTMCMGLRVCWQSQGGDIQGGTEMVHKPPSPSVGLGAQDCGQLWG